MSEFFSIKPANKTDETGSDFPQLMIVEDYNFKAQNSVHNISFHELPNFNPDIRFRLSQNAKLTSICSQAAIASFGFIMHKDLVDFLNQLNLPKYKTFEVTLSVDEGHSTEYLWVQFIDSHSKNLINWRKSKFIIKKLSKYLGEVTINDFEDYIQKSKEIGSLKKIKVEHLVLNSHPDYHIFYFPFSSKIYVSKELHSQLLSTKFTGIKFTEENSISILKSQV